MTREDLATEVSKFINTTLPEGDLDLDDASSEIGGFLDDLIEKADVGDQD
jgi:hypothetical protein